MVDMGQADRTLQARQEPMPYSWENVKTNTNVTRGDVCVIRRSNGSPEILRIHDQTHYREWVGCFSII
jgi:hypothetical protein